MSQHPRRSAILVGVFVTIAAVILSACVLFIGQLTDAFAPKVAVSAVFEQVNGLQQGDNIWLAGMKVGIVKTLTFDQWSRVRVDLRIDRTALQHIAVDAVASIGSDGLIGNRIVVIACGTADGPTLEDGGELHTAATVSSQALMATLQENDLNLLAITGDLAGLTHRVAAGEGSVGRLLARDELYDRVDHAAATLDRAAGSAESVAAGASAFMAQAYRPGALPHELVNDRATWPAVKSSVAGLDSTGRSAAALVADLGAGVRDPTTPVGVLVHDHEVGADVRATLGNLRNGSRLLAEDLEALRHNCLLRGYFEAQARAAARARARASEKAPAPASAPDPSAAP